MIKVPKVSKGNKAFDTSDTFPAFDTLSNMTLFKQKVIEVIKSIPPGKVVSYGQVALYIGAPRAARQVGWTLRQIGPEIKIPWWRVINQKGRISIDGNLHADRDLQKKLLLADGVEVKDYMVDMKEYRFNPSPEDLKRMQLGDEYIERIGNKFSI